MHSELLDIFENLTKKQFGENTFNPYIDKCKIHDNVDSPKIRRNNLKLYLEAMDYLKPRDLWIAEAVGAKGSRRTGIPLIPENLLDRCSELLQTKEKFKKATKTKTEGILTANIIWREIENLKIIPFLWNTVLHHPHTQQNKLKNRTPNVSEIKLYIPILERIIYYFQFQKIICIGKISYSFLSSLSINCSYVRHPSMGGIKKFREGILNLYSE
jgi:hypothetical protein